jgi:hypothetical protein
MSLAYFMIFEDLRPNVGVDILINPDSVASVQRRACPLCNGYGADLVERTVIAMRSGQKFHVKGSLADVWSKLIAAGKSP